MNIGIIGLGRMGLPMATLLIKKGHAVIGYDSVEAVRVNAEKEGVSVAQSVDELIHTLVGAKVLLVMVQRAHVENVLSQLDSFLSEGDVVIDGGNSYFEDSRTRAEKLSQRGVWYIDAGVSGGVGRAQTGASIMVGGEKEAIAIAEPLIQDLAQAGGYQHVGKSGSGHFVKMVHNGIEYGMMQAIGEGVEALDAYKEKLGLSIASAISVYNNGSIIEGALMRWLGEAWHEDENLTQVIGTVPKGDTEEEMELLSKLHLMPALDVALEERKKSRKNPRVSMKAVSVMRHKFGAHAIIARDEKKEISHKKVG